MICVLQILLAQLTRQPEYMEAAQAFCDFTVDYQKRTPKGLVYIDKFGTLCHAANVAFVCLQVFMSILHRYFVFLKRTDCIFSSRLHGTVSALYSTDSPDHGCVWIPKDDGNFHKSLPLDHIL